MERNLRINLPANRGTFATPVAATISFSPSSARTDLKKSKRKCLPADLSMNDRSRKVFQPRHSPPTIFIEFRTITYTR